MSTSAEFEASSDIRLAKGAAEERRRLADEVRKIRLANQLQERRRRDEAADRACVMRHEALLHAEMSRRREVMTSSRFRRWDTRTTADHELDNPVQEARSIQTGNQAEAERNGAEVMVGETEAEAQMVTYMERGLGIGCVFAFVLIAAILSIVAVETALR